MMNDFNWDTGFTVDFNMQTGFSKTAESTKRYLSQMKDIFYDSAAVNEILQHDNPLIYEFYGSGGTNRAGDLSFGTTILYAGKIGNEYYMTKGHFHIVLETSEVYYILNGKGYMVMENPEGDTIELPFEKGEAVYVPRRYAHRTVNTGEKALIMLFIYAADAGHDYKTIETKGYRHLIVEKDQKPSVIANPRWK